MRLQSQRGLGMAELLVGLVLGLLVTLAGLALFLASHHAQGTVDDNARMAESGALAIETISRAVRQSAYIHWDKSDAPIGLAPGFAPALSGLDGANQGASSEGMDIGGTAAVNDSDVLAVRFFGSGSGDNGDGSIVNCAGFGVAAPSNAASAEAQRGWSIFYVARSAAGQPELRCKYNARGANGVSWQSDAIVSDVESLQFLYGVDTNGNGDAERYYGAAELNTLDTQIAVVGSTDAEKALDRIRKSWWKKVVALKVAVLVRSSQPVRAGLANAVIDLFGPLYSEVAPKTDAGARLDESKLPVDTRPRLRRVFRTTILLRNASNGGAA